MSKFIVFEWTGEIRGPRKGEHYETPGGDVLMCVEPDRAIGWYRIFRRLSDADVEALETRLRPVSSDPTWACPACGWRSSEHSGLVQRDGFPAECPECHSTDVVDSVAAALGSAIDDRDEWRERAEKAEAEREAANDTALMRLGMLSSARERAEKMERERDDLRAKVDEYDSRQTGIRIALDAICPDMDGQRVIDPIERITRLGAEVARLRRMFETSGTPGSLADTRARFERETAALLFARFVSVDGDTAKDELSADEAVKCARRFADRFFGPAPAAVFAGPPCDLVASDVPPTPTITAFEGRPTPAPVKGDAPPQFKVGDPIIHCSGRRGKIVAIHADATHKATITWSNGTTTAWQPLADLRPAPPEEPWTPKRGDEVIASTYIPSKRTRLLVGSVGTVAYVGAGSSELPIFEVSGYWFHASDLQLVRRAEDAAS